MGKAHFLVYCDRQLVDTAIQSILDSDPTIEVVSNEVIRTESIEETTDKYIFRRGREHARLAIIIGDPESQAGPYNGEYWIFIDGEPEGFFKCNEPFARELTEILVAHGARETRRKDLNSPFSHNG